MPREDKAAFEQVPTEPVAEFAQKFRIPAKCLLLVYLLLVVYGSLVTRKVYSYSLLEAWEIFKNIPYFSLGADRRQDLLANLVLYVPLGFLGCFLHWTKRAEGRLPLYRAAILLLLGIALATLIEFVQVYFKRTVSLNDLLVESIGVLIGITVWQLCWRDIINQLQRVRLGSLETLKAVLIAYTVLYVLLSVFPYDFVISWNELSAKWAEKPIGVGWNSCESLAWCSLRPFIEIATVMPVGLCIILTKPLRNPYKSLVIMGVLLSLLLEILQYLTISGHTALLSFVTRPLGFMLTFWIYSRHQLLLQLLDTHFGLIVKAALIPYLVALAGVNGLLEFHIPNYEDFIDKLANTKYIPFYYHYFNSEVAAVKSVLAQFIMYSPLGGLVWGWSIKDRKQWSLARCNQIVIVLGFGLSSAMWLGRSYFSSHLFADPTNVLIGTISSFFGFVIASKGYQLLNKKNVPTPVPNGHIDGAIAGNNSAVFYRYVVPPACLFLLATLYSFYPYKLAILGFVVALLVGIWRKTERWLFIVPALLPVLDFKPVTGLFLFDELDFLLLSVLLVLSVRLKITSTQWWYDLNFMRWPLILLAISYGFSFVIRMLSDHALGQESHFNHYYDQWHSLRLLKGFIYPILFLPFIHHSLSQSPYLIKRFFYGCMTGITIVCLVVVAERWGFSSITDLDQHYRVAALFSSMHIGGQHLDAFLVMTAPCVAALLWWKNRYLKYCVGMLLSVLVSYSVFVTFSRWTLVSYLLVLFVMIVIWLIGHTSSRWRNSRWVMILLLFALLPLSFGVFTADTYLKERMQRFDQDTSIRVGHWFEAIRLGQAGIIDNALGMGLGGYPAAYLKTLAKEDRPGSFAIQEDKDKSFLRLEGGGKNLYLTQYISLPNVENLILSLSARGKGQEPLVVRFKICEKSIMYSRACHKLPVMLQQDSWDDYTLGVELKQTKLKHRGQGYSMSPRIPLFLSITTPPLGSQIDVTNIRLIDGEGNNLIENGGFEAGENYWFFSSDDHLIWHIKNIFAHLFVEQGWLGMIAFILLVFAVLNGAMQSRQNDSLVASILIGAIYGYCFVGLAGSLMDAYQLMIYFYLFVWVGIYSLNARSLIQSG